MPRSPVRPWPPDSSQIASGIPGAVHIAFWDYLGARLGCADPSSVPDLPQLVSTPLPRP
jgi:hypothetical protein